MRPFFIQLSIQGPPSSQNLAELGVAGNAPNQRHVLGFTYISVDASILKAKVGIEERSVFSASGTFAVALAALGVPLIKPADDQRSLDIEDVFSEPVVLFKVSGRLLFETGCRAVPYHN